MDSACSSLKKSGKVVEKSCFVLYKATNVSHAMIIDDKNITPFCAKIY